MGDEHLAHDFGLANSAEIFVVAVASRWRKIVPGELRLKNHR